MTATLSSPEPVPGIPTTAPATPERTKTRLLELVKRHGPLTAQELAARLEVSVPAARRHLGDLQEQGLLECRTERPAGRGRPQHVFALTDQGEARFPKTYADLCVDILRHVERLHGSGTVLTVLQMRNNEMAEQLQGHIPGDESLESRAERLRQHLAEMGFDPTLEHCGDELYLVQRNCPNLTVARQYRALCQAELELYIRVLGIDITRSSTIACGQGQCRYRLR